MAGVALGLMSGTSCDGVSAALARFDGRRVRVIAAATQPYPAAFAARLRAAAALAAPELSALDVALGERFAQAAQRLLRQARWPARRVAVIGSHGHTVYHGPGDVVPSTLQLGCPAVIAERLGRPVVADFRPRDVAAGGEGAPLVPAFDEAFFGGGPVRALLNLGGIANVTVVGRGLAPLAFDTGPGNTLMDELVQARTRGRRRYDPGGRLAARGAVDARALARLWRHPYFRRPPPKSTGRETFNQDVLRRAFGRALAQRPDDVLATVTYFTAWSVARGLRRFVPHPVTEVIVSGGGVRNRTLMRHLARCLAPAPVRRLERYGIPAQAKEPVAFAYFALQHLRGRPHHAPSATGARSRRPLGSLTPAA
jgi:anhydro-N-acetylmuramic acid kinase